jgi:hypothetical protein
MRRLSRGSHIAEQLWSQRLRDRLGDGSLSALCRDAVNDRFRSPDCDRAPRP